MHHFFIKPDNIRDSLIVIEDAGDINHIKNVLRMRVGEKVTFCCEDEPREYVCVLASLTNDQICAAIEDINGVSGELPCRLILFQGIPKGDKMDLIIQKAVELGVFAIVPVAMKRCVVKLDGKRAEKKIRRWNEIAKGAASQAKRNHVPLVYPMMDFEEAVDYAKRLDVLLLPYEDAQGIAHSRKVIESVKGEESAGIFIGPEGGFDHGEVKMSREAGAIPITLGHRILRTETAGMAVLSILMFMLDED